MAEYLCLQQQNEVNGGWSSPIQIGGLAVNEVACCQNSNGLIEVFWADENLQIMHSWQSAVDGSSYVTPQPFGSVPAKQMVLSRDQQGRLTLCFVSNTNQLYVAWQETPGNISWQQIVFDVPATQVTLYPNANGLLEVFFVGTDTFIYNTSQFANLTWREPIKTAWAGKQAVLSRNGDGRLEMFYVGLNNLIYHAWQPNPGAGPWQEAQLSGGAQTIVAGNNSDQTISIFYIGLDGYIYHNTQTANGWGGDIRAFQGPYYQGQAEALALGRNQDGRLQLFYEGTDGYSYATWQGTQNGAYVGGNRNSPAIAFSSLTSFDGKISLFYVGQSSAPNAAIKSLDNQYWIQASGLFPGSQIQVNWIHNIPEPGGTTLTTTGSPTFTVSPDGTLSEPIPNIFVIPGATTGVNATEQGWFVILGENV